MKESFTRELGKALVQELAAVVAAMLDGSADVGLGVPQGGTQWIAEIRLEGERAGGCAVAFDGVAALDLTGRIMGIDDEVPTEAVIDTFRELCNQALGALSQKPEAAGTTLKLAGVSAALELEPGQDWTVYAIRADKLSNPITVTFWGDLQGAPLTQAAPVASPQPKTPAARPAPAPSAAPPAVAPAPAAAPGPADRIDVILDIDLPLTVRFGRTHLPLKALTRIAPGSLIDLGRSPDDPVEILVGNRVVAKGEVVIVSGNYGIRILDVVSPRDRARSLEA
jgi:flagellar motor switch protein FliN